MGAQQACEAVYRDAMKWFKQYIDKDTYVSNFQALDRDKDGGVDMQELQVWVSQNAAEHPEAPWSMLEGTGVVLMMCFKVAACHMDNEERLMKQRKIVDISDLRALLLHMYAFSVFYRHFSASDNKPSRMMQKKKMNELEFVVACESLCYAHGCSPIPVDTLKSDFLELDSNYSGSLGYIQICQAACKFVNTPPDLPEDAPQQVLPELSVSMSLAKATKKNISKASKILGITLQENSTNVMADFQQAAISSPNKVHAVTGMSPIEKTNLAIEQIRNKANREDKFIKKFMKENYERVCARFEAGEDPPENFGDNEIAAIGAELSAIREKNNAV